MIRVTASRGLGKLRKATVFRTGVCVRDGLQAIQLRHQTTGSRCASGRQYPELRSEVAGSFVDRGKMASRYDSRDNLGVISLPRLSGKNVGCLLAAEWRS